MKIAVGFITYNDYSAKYLPYFLNSLFKALEVFRKEDVLILIKDNSDKKNNSNWQYLNPFLDKEDYRINFKWSGENQGFSKGYNEMIDEAIIWGADSFLMINPDTFLSSDSLFKLNKVLFEKSDLASVAPKVLRWDFNNKKLSNQIDTCGISMSPGLKFFDLGQGEEDIGQFDGVDILGPSGAAALYKVSALLDIKDDFGFLDSRMFMYKEDCDLNYRLFLRGFKSKLVSESLVYHDRTVAAANGNFLKFFKNRLNKNRNVRIWSFVNQHLLYIKFWHNQNQKSKFMILIYLILAFFYALFFENFLLRQYKKIFYFLKNNTKLNT